MIRVLSRLRSEPWAITREVMETIVEIAERQNESPQAVAAKLGRPLEHTYDVENRDGVAVLHVTGPMFRYANLFTAISGATSYDLLARDFARVVNDERIDAIVLDIDSPGGEANGVSEFADMIHAAREVKPVVAYVGGYGASAAYWIASAAQEVVINETAILGSLGTVLAIEDSRDRDAKNGVRRTEIVSSQSPYKRVDYATDDGRARLQARVDALSDVFLAKVARNRGVDVETVTQQYGQGDVLVGQAAITAGLADRIGSYEGVISQLQARVRASAGALAAAGSTEKESFMDKHDGAPAADKPTQLTAAQVTEQHPAAAEGIRSEAHAVGRSEERRRIQTILASEHAQGREDLARHLAFESDAGADAATALLQKAPKASTSNGFDKLDAAMRGVGNATVGADADAEEGGEDSLIQTAKALGLAS
ncbi:S49 family peptidase [Lysobacter sp. LF1]|uniref:S49 family peptidase n=1 Tax=Lysobacter stagni TaxID=3045172 RepID=A0ABT6XKP9_9GAMM|nr:S49 family peptidase [Lysobacter sp. LF1]MDI9240745.1 S49 family peptidase [Lysobacter sp. LF1]